MPGEQSEREETRPVVPASVHGPGILDSAHTVSSPGLEKEEEQAAVPTDQATLTAAHSPERDPTPSRGIMPALIPRYRRRPVFIFSSVVILVLVLVLFITDVGHITSAPVTARRTIPTATTTPTATLTAVPTPTTRSGFQIFIDTNDGFLLQYPIGWTHDVHDSVAEFTDNAVTPTFNMQVLPPSFLENASPSGDPKDPTSWVNFAMQSYASLLGFQQEAGPLPEATFGGATWQTARALVSTQVDGVSQPVLQIQVYATIYQGKPYIIGLYATASVFNLADKIYFHPMRESFEFLPVAS